MPDYKESNKVEKKSLVSLSVYNVGQQKCPPSYQWGPGIRDHFLIHYIISGKGTYTAGGKIWHLQAGDCFLAFPGTTISYRADHADPWEYVWVGFAGSDAAAIIEATDFSPEHLVLPAISCGSALKERLLGINRSFGNSFSASIEMTGQLYLALNLLVAISSKKSKGPGSQDAANARKAVTYIDSRYSYNIAIEDVADFIGVSRSTLFRLFKKSFGISPKQYLDDLRVKKACLLLEDTDLPVGSIALSVGIENSMYFSKVFRKYKGVSPTTYRERMHTQG